MSTHPMNINQEACEWIAKMHDVDLSVEQAEKLRQWMAQSPAHKQELKRMAQRWDELNVLTELAVPLIPDAMPVDKNQRSPAAALGFFETLASAIRSSLSAVPGMREAGAADRLSRGSLLGSAAVLMLVVGLVFTLPGNPIVNTQTYSTAIGEQRRIVLPDNSEVQLNTNSIVVVTYTASERGIHLQQGEAHFTVSHNPQKPFRVRAGNGIVRAVGTAFSVRLYASSVDVIVTEGRVALNKVSTLAPALPSTVPFSEAEKTFSEPLSGRAELTQNDAEPAYLDAGQAAIFDTATHSVELIEGLDTDELKRKLLWRNGLIRFAGAPLEEVVAEISRYTALNIVIREAELKTLRIGGLFKVGETQKMFDVLETGFGVYAHQVDGNTIYLSANKPIQ